jgi:hypothetical protein
VAKPDTLILDGHAYRWQQLCELRRAQLEAWHAAQPRQLALFELREDCRPPAERTAARRYREPTLFPLMLGKTNDCFNSELKPQRSKAPLRDPHS